MTRNTRGLRRGGPGRPKGALNKVTREMATFWREFLDSDDYRASAVKRVLAGTASHLENYWNAKLHGKPTEVLDPAGNILPPPRVIFELRPST